MRRPLSWLMGGLLCLSLAVSSAAPAAEPPREPQPADIQKQLQEFAKKLQELWATSSMPASQTGTLDPAWVKTLNWRCIGPATMGGRITDIAVEQANPYTYWIATASGGLLKTTDNGVTFSHQFDHEATVSVGAVAVAPSDARLVWVGTGESNPRNSVSYGDGVYKSTDGGKTWKHMGLKNSFQIGRIVIHPKDPNIVYVGALGRLYGPNEERGLFKTTDGGQSWEKVLYIDERTGIIDARMNPADPEELIVAAWERQRDEFDSHRGEPPPADGYDPYDPAKKWGPGSGLYRTRDGGKHFEKLTRGLPTCALGRIGIDYYRKDPHTLFAIIDCEKIGMGTPPSTAYLGVQGEDAPGGGAKLTEVNAEAPAGKAGLKAGDIVKVIDKKEIKTYHDLADLIGSHKVGDKLTLTVQRDKESQDFTATLEERPEGQGGQPRVFAGILGEDTAAGVRLTQVSPETPAGKAGLHVEDVIQALDKHDVKTLRELGALIREHKAGDKVTLRLQRGKESKEVELTLETPPGSNPKRPYSFWYGGQQANVQDKQGPESFQYGGVYKSTDGGDSWSRVNSLNPRPMYFSQVRVDPNDDNHVYVLGIALYRSHDGGKTFSDDGGRAVHADQHALWIDPQDGRHMLVGCDGGFYVTYDRMDHWDYLNNVAIGQFYHVAVDSRQPYRIYGGLQDNGSWSGPSQSLSGGGAGNDEWFLVAGGDGFVVRVDPNDPDLVYFESQDGSMGRRNLRTGEMTTFRHEAPRGEKPYRFNWNTPFILSSHNSHIFYCAGNYVLRSLEQGENLRPISPEISRTKRGMGTALAESPRNPEVLWAGTDDGALWVTRDGGVKWTNVADRVGLPGPRCVASIEASRFEEGRAYVVFDAHRSNDDEPYVFVTEDHGQTWKSLLANLPTGSTRVLREDLENPNLLYLGTEFAVWASLDRGASWTKINNNLPTVAVHEFAVHPTAGELVAATHGRSLWILDVSALRQMTPEVLRAKAHLFKPATATRWRWEPSRGSPFGNGDRHFVGQNPPRGAVIYYSLTRKADRIGLKVLDYTGKTVREWPTKDEPLSTEPGLHRVVWNLLTGVERERSGGGRRPRQERPQPVAGGMYRVVLSVNGEDMMEGVRVEVDPLAGKNLTTEEDDEEEEERDMKATRIDD